ncbi:alpha/beta fold hydrolase [Sphingomonas sp.]|uniref:alpha/beta fold hydrolase n=1 Tax=Sphingomonas sp. TaxID=28214 RepID=UPI002FC63249
MASWVDGYWSSSDGLRLHYRDYAGGDAHLPIRRPPIICIPGLTRNARDFEAVAERLAGAWRLICVDLRGRGESGFASDSADYNPSVYLRDLEALIAELDLERFILFGTSLGGLLTMLLALNAGALNGSSRIAGALLNDIGPEIDPEGLDRIRGYVGRSQSWPTWLHAADHFADAHGHIYPRWKGDEWLAHAKRLCRISASGRIILDYDLRIAEPLKAARGEAGADMWQVFAAMHDVPSLVLRGEHSDILAPATLARMAAENPAMEAVVVPDVGHAPTLEEPEAVAAIERLLARAEAAPRR